MRKKVYFSEIIFTNEYYINGVNILDDNNVEYLGNIDIDLKVNLSFSKIDNAKLIKIKDLNFEIVIAEVKDFKIVCYLKSNMFYKICNHPRHQESLYKNYNLLEEYVIDKMKNISSDNIVYSPDCKTRGYISNENGIVSLKYQRLEIEDEEGFYFYENVNSDDFWSWEDLSGISYFDTVESARKEASLYLANYVSERGRFYEQPKNVLLQYESTKFQTWIYIMKFGIIGPIIIILLSCLIPICGQGNWNVLWLSGGWSLFAIIFASVLVWTEYNPIMYAITDKSIIAYKGIYRECLFENIKSIKIKRCLFNKNKGSIKFKLYKGSSVNYNFDNIENPEEAYNIIKKHLSI